MLLFIVVSEIPSVRVPGGSDGGWGVILPERLGPGAAVLGDGVRVCAR